VVTSAFPHQGEEDCLRGWNGSGTIFFGHCNLRCVFCQNYDISQGLAPGPRRTVFRRGKPDLDHGEPAAVERIVGSRGTPPEELAALMVGLQELGCHNINLVTPEHVVPQVLEALVPAVKAGLRLPLVYNTSAYDALETLALLDGVVDIYMPDLKFLDSAASRRYLKAEDYPSVAKAALREMQRQVGPLKMDGRGLAYRGVLIRHLVMPGLPEESEAIFRWIALELGTDTYVNVMGQYRPGGLVGGGRYREIDGSLNREDLRRALEAARKAGLTRLDRV
jgi:putative pyruvate formate lyase activating enzyme